MWQQTVSAKIDNQACMMESVYVAAKNLRNWALEVKSGDSENHEAVAAAYYWKSIFAIYTDFRRDPEGEPPNNLLNYGYSILRPVTARNLVASGLLPTLGIFHKNQYNAYCLADDIMKPYRPFVDKVVWNIVRMNGNFFKPSHRNEKVIAWHTCHGCNNKRRKKSANGGSAKNNCITCKML